jgi:hypothetical protein
MSVLRGSNTRFLLGGRDALYQQRLNRLHHDGIANVPDSMWAGTKAGVKHMRTFGSKVLVKRGDYRPTKVNRH